MLSVAFEKLWETVHKQTKQNKKITECLIDGKNKRNTQKLISKHVESKRTPKMLQIKYEAQMLPGFWHIHKTK